MVQHPRILKLSNQPKFFGFFVSHLRPCRVPQNLGRPTRRNLDFFVDVFLDVDRLPVFQGFEFVVHAGQPGGRRLISLAIPGRMTTDGTGLTVGMQNVTTRDARQRQRAAPLNVDFVGLECGIVHLQIVGHNQSQSVVMCSTSACVSIQTRAPQWSGVCEWMISQGPWTLTLVRCVEPL